MAADYKITAYEIPHFQFTLPTNSTIPRYRFVAVDTVNAGEAVLFDGTDTNVCVGVSRQTNTEDFYEGYDTYPCVIADGIMMVEAGAALTAGQKVISNTEGKAIPATGSGTEVIVGVALVPAEAAGVITCVKTTI